MRVYMCVYVSSFSFLFFFLSYISSSSSSWDYAIHIATVLISFIKACLSVRPSVHSYIPAPNQLQTNRCHTCQKTNRLIDPGSTDPVRKEGTNRSDCRVRVQGAGRSEVEWSFSVRSFLGHMLQSFSSFCLLSCFSH